MTGTSQSDDGQWIWTGRRWKQMPHHAPPQALRLMLALSVAGIALVVGGGVVATRSRAWSGPIDCASDSIPMPPASLWLIWLALAALATVAVVLFAARGRGDGRMAWLAALGMSSAVVTFPFWMAMGAGMGCGL